MNQIKKTVLEWIGKNATVTAGAAIIIAIGSVALDFRKEDRYDYQDLLNEFRLEVNRLRAVEQNCTQMMLQYGREISSLRQKIVMLESAQMSSPLPMWLKSSGSDDRPGVMLTVNQAYEDRYLIPFGKTADDYIGRTDIEAWGEELGSQYWSNDMKVIRSGEPIDVMTTDPFGDPIRVIKYPRRFGGRVVGIAGVAIPE